MLIVALRGRRDKKFVLVLRDYEGIKEKVSFFILLKTRMKRTRRSEEEKETVSKTRSPTREIGSG